MNQGPLINRSDSPYARGLLLVVFLMGTWLLSFGGVLAQENYEIQVYDSETETPGKVMVELHSNMAVKGTTQKTEGVLPTQHALHETLEVTYGFTPWFETGFYIFTSIQPGMGWQWVGDHIRPKVRVPESWDWPVGVALSTEFGYQRRKFSTDTWSIEIRPIIDKKIGRWYLSFNPVLGRSLKGDGTNRGFEFNPNFKISYEFSSKISGGFEYYGSLGPLSGFDPLKEQKHQIFPVVDLNLGADWELNFGVGMGLTSSTDRLIIKTIVGRRF
ncbi:MAG TPA: hypothetical protein VLZ03_05295 [Thermodesulfobacteriota bacterium]|nr:hypothetical protein [Thermodesulfobacteriota bacterium]